MDEIRAVNKSISELKTIQNRLKKVLKNREWVLSYEIPRLEAIIKEKDDEIKSLQNGLRHLKGELESKIARLEEVTSLFDKARIDKQRLEKENKTLRSKIRELKSDYLYRSLTAKTQFYEEKNKQLKEKIALMEKAKLGNYMNLEDLVDKYRQSLLLEIATLESRNKTLEKINDDLLKDNIELRKS